MTDCEVLMQDIYALFGINYTDADPQQRVLLHGKHTSSSAELGLICDKSSGTFSIQPALDCSENIEIPDFDKYSLIESIHAFNSLTNNKGGAK